MGNQALGILWTSTLTSYISWPIAEALRCTCKAMSWIPSWAPLDYIAALLYSFGSTNQYTSLLEAWISEVGTLRSRALYIHTPAIEQWRAVALTYLHTLKTKPSSFRTARIELSTRYGVHDEWQLHILPSWGEFLHVPHRPLREHVAQFRQFQYLSRALFQLWHMRPATAALLQWLEQTDISA